MSTGTSAYLLSNSDSPYQRYGESEVSTLEGPELQLDVSALHYRGVYCSWRCLHYRDLSCIWMCLHCRGVYCS